MCAASPCGEVEQAYAVAGSGSAGEAIAVAIEVSLSVGLMMMMMMMMMRDVEQLKHRHSRFFTTTIEYFTFAATLSTYRVFIYF